MKYHYQNKLDKFKELKKKSDDLNSAEKRSLNGLRWVEVIKAWIRKEGYKLLTNLEFISFYKPMF
jgi:hypothetical protein